MNLLSSIDKIINQSITLINVSMCVMAVIIVVYKSQTMGNSWTAVSFWYFPHTFKRQYCTTGLILLCIKISPLWMLLSRKHVLMKENYGLLKWCMLLRCVMNLKVTLLHMCNNHNATWWYWIVGLVNFHACAFIDINPKYSYRISSNMPSL